MKNSVICHAVCVKNVGAVDAHSFSALAPLLLPHCAVENERFCFKSAIFCLPGRVISDPLHFRLSRDTSRLQLNRKPYFLGATHDHFLIMHKLNAVEQITLQRKMMNNANGVLLKLVHSCLCEYATVRSLRHSANSDIFAR